MGIEDYKELWNSSVIQGFWCCKHSIHQTRTGFSDWIGITPEQCFKCDKNIINGGICDPI